MKQETGDHARADRLLGQIAQAKEAADAIDARYEGLMARLKARYEREMAPYKDAVKGMEKELVRHMKRRSDVLFDGQDRVDLASGALLHRVEDRVKRARGVLDQLEKHGFTDAIKVAKSVDWDALEKWPAEKLVMVGTERVRKERFEYELQIVSEKTGD